MKALLRRQHLDKKNKKGEKATTKFLQHEGGGTTRDPTAKQRRRNRVEVGLTLPVERLAITISPAQSPPDEAKSGKGHRRG